MHFPVFRVRSGQVSVSVVLPAADCPAIIGITGPRLQHPPSFLPLVHPQSQDPALLLAHRLLFVGSACEPSLPSDNGRCKSCELLTEPAYIASQTNTVVRDPSNMKHQYGL